METERLNEILASVKPDTRIRITFKCGEGPKELICNIVISALCSFRAIASKLDGVRLENLTTAIFLDYAITTHLWAEDWHRTFAVITTDKLCVPQFVKYVGPAVESIMVG